MKKEIEEVIGLDCSNAILASAKKARLLGTPHPRAAHIRTVWLAASYRQHALAACNTSVLPHLCSNVQASQQNMWHT